MYLWKSNICSHELDVQQANISVSQLYRIGNCSLDAGSRMHCILALDLWEVVIEVLHSPNNNTPPTQKNSANEGRAKGAAVKLLAHFKRHVEDQISIMLPQTQISLK